VGVGIRGKKEGGKKEEKKKGKTQLESMLGILIADSGSRGYRNTSVIEIAV
jgi:hypothetical protein